MHYRQIYLKSSFSISSMITPFMFGCFSKTSVRACMALEAIFLLGSPILFTKFGSKICMEKIKGFNMFQYVNQKFETIKFIVLNKKTHSISKKAEI